MQKYVTLGFLAVLAFFIWYGFAFASDPPATKAGTEKVFAKELEGGYQLIVSRQSVESPDDLAPLLSEPWRKRAKRAFTINVVLRNSTGKEIQIASRVQLEHMAEFSGDKGFLVLDAVVDDGEVIIAFGAGDFLGLWHIELDSMSHDEIAYPDKWQLSQKAASVTPDTVGVHISRLPDRRWRVTVTDKQIEGPPTVFEQTKDKWNLTMTQGVWKDNQGKGDN